MLAALAFIPVVDLLTAFAEYKRQIPQEILPVVNYFDENYITGKVYL